MSVMNFLFLNGAVEAILYSLSWGTVGYLFFRMVGVRKEYWFIDFIFVLVLLVIWEFTSGHYLGMLEITIGNQEVVDFFDGVARYVPEFGFLDVLFAAAEVLAGYLLGIWFLRRLSQRFSAL